VLVAVGLNRSTAFAADWERMPPASGEADPDLAAFVALGGIDEVAVVSNGCRVELYAATRCPAAAVLALRHALAARAGRELPVFALQGEDAFHHLVRVASGLDSPVLGEANVLANVKAGFERAVESGAAGLELMSTLERVLRIAWRVRTETSIGRAGISWGHAVASLAEKVLGRVAGRRVALVDANEMARISGELLGARGAEVVVLDRSVESALALAGALGAEARPLEALEDELLRADVVVSAAAAAPPPFAPAAMARIARARARPLVLVDLASPRVIPAETGAVADVYLCDADDLRRVMRATLGSWAVETAQAERLLDEEVRRWARGDADPRPAADLLPLQNAV
jgi:glutamyl-tRNA reductase